VKTCQASNTTIFIFAVFVVSLSLTPSVKCSVFYINITIAPTDVICVIFDSPLTFSEHQSTVADWLTHSPATLDVPGSRRNSGDFSGIYFLESIQSPAQRDFEKSVFHCRNFL